MRVYALRLKVTKARAVKKKMTNSAACCRGGVGMARTFSCSGRRGRSAILSVCLSQAAFLLEIDTPVEHLNLGRLGRSAMCGEGEARSRRSIDGGRVREALDFTAWSVYRPQGWPVIMSPLDVDVGAKGESKGSTRS
jgi:hypothetical protein